MAGVGGGADQGVVTPEAVRLELATATVGSRGVAFLLDLVVLSTITALLSVATAMLDVDLGSAPVPGWLGVSVLVVAGLAVLLGYPVGFETVWHGRTPGKAALGLRVVTREGGPIGFRHAMVRAVFGLLELLGTVGALAIVTAMINPRGQRLGDLVAGTLVLRERSAAGPARAVDFAPPAGLEEYAARLDLGRVGGRDYQSVRTLLLRFDELTPQARARLARQLAVALEPRVRPAPPGGIGPESFLRCVAAAYQQRGRPSSSEAATAAAGHEPADDRSRPATAAGGERPAESREPPPAPPRGPFAPPG